MEYAFCRDERRGGKKLQIPNSEIQKSTRSQTPNTKLQTPEKLQAPSSKRWLRFGAWNLGFLWCLEFGFWCFEIWNFSGAWALVLGVSIAPVPTLTAALTSGPAGF